jgi:hypothetical protein
MVPLRVRGVLLSWLPRKKDLNPLTFPKRCRLSWLTNSAVIYEPKGAVAGSQAMEIQLYTRAQINFGDLCIYNLCMQSSEHQAKP